MVDSSKHELYRYRYAVHCYLDALWLISSSKYNARTTWYNWLANQMNKSPQDAHVSKFSLEECKYALSILKPKYKQLTGRNNIPKSIRKKMYYNRVYSDDIINGLCSQKYNKEGSNE